MNMTSTTKVTKKRLSQEFITSHLQAYYRAPHTVSFRKFCSSHNIKVSNLGKVWWESGLNEMKKNKTDISVAMETLKTFLDERKKPNNKKMNVLHKNNEYLTDDEELLVINVEKF